MKRRVVVTGLGLVTPVGNTVAESWEALVAGRSGAAAISRFDAAKLPVKFACEVKGFDPLAYLEKKESRRMDLFSQFAVAAAQQAICDAGLDGQGRLPDPDRAGAVVGTGTGGIATFEDQCRTYLESGPNRVSPFFIPMFMPNAAAGLLSMRFGFRGPNYCTVSACASSAHAVGEATRAIQQGEADVMIAGGAEAAITPLAIASFANMKALSTRNATPETASRPFDKERDGFVMGDGGGAAILESLEHAVARGARIYAEVAGFGMSADAYHITSPPDEGQGAQLAIRRCLADGGIDPKHVGYINAHGTSTPQGDIAETRAVKAIFGEQARKLVFGSTKSMTGHLLGGSGIVEFVISILVLRHDTIPPTINQFTPDPACDLDSAPNRAAERHVDVALSNSFGFGGHNVTLAVRRYQG